WLPRQVGMPLAARPAVLTVVGEQDGGADRVAAVLGTQSGQIGDQRLLLVGGDERVMKPTPLQDIRQRHAREWTRRTREKGPNVDTGWDRVGSGRAGGHLDDRARRLSAGSALVGGRPEGSAASAGGRTVTERPTSLA